MRKPIIIGNWKMNKTVSEAVAFINEVDPHVHGNATFGVATSFLALDASLKAAKNLVVAAQNCHYEASGAFTGEVSVEMLEELGVKYVIVGHSERREMFGDCDCRVNKKVLKLLSKGLTPIFCIGETETQFDAKETEAVIRSQVSKGLKDVQDVTKVVIAYEPIWAIGTGKSATKEIANACCGIVRDEVAKLFGSEAAEKVLIQYGGSVKPENIEEYMAEEHIDGALIGGASLKADSFISIIEKVK